jgi:hypothetical protein
LLESDEELLLETEESDEELLLESEEEEFEEDDIEL